MSIFGLKTAEDALFNIWQKSENNFFAREKMAILRHKICDTDPGYTPSGFLKRFFGAIFCGVVVGMILI